MRPMSKIPVVFLHGLGGSSVDWDSVGKILGKSHPVFALDLPNGANNSWKGAFDPKSLSGWLATALAERKVDRAHLVGHSLGGRVAGELAARDADRVASLALVSPLGAAGYGLSDRMKWKAMSRAALLRSVPESKMRSALGYGFVNEGSEAARRFVSRAMAARTGPRAAAALAALEKSVDGVLDAPPLTERLRKTKAPLLLLGGSDDPLVPVEETTEIRSARPDAKAKTLFGQGHYPMIEDPTRLAAALRDFLASV